LGRLSLGLLVLQIIALPVFLLLQGVPGLAERWYVGAELSLILFPYMILICVGALVCGMLNVLGRFGLAAMNQVWLNLAMIGTLIAGYFWFPEEGMARVYILCFGVLAGGLFQLAVPAWGLYRRGWRPRLRLQKHPGLAGVQRLFLPALLGAAIFQINILVCRFLAFAIDDTATGLLYLANRLVELPLGVFAIAVTTVVFPELSRLNAAGRGTDFRETFTRGLGLIFMLMLPATVGLIALGQPILGFLFQWGLFNRQDVQLAYPVLAASALGLPFFAWSTLLTRVWYARQEMKVPVRLAAVNLLLNLVLGLLLMGPLGAVGLALANTLSSLIHCLALQFFLPGQWFSGLRFRSIAVLVLALALLSGISIGGTHFLQMLDCSRKISDLLTVALVIPSAAVGYFGLLWAMRYPALRELASKR
jgi:putative peptidoglycan lipid II flippase